MFPLKSGLYYYHSDTEAVGFAGPVDFVELFDFVELVDFAEHRIFIFISATFAFAAIVVAYIASAAFVVVVAFIIAV